MSDKPTIESIRESQRAARDAMDVLRAHHHEAGETEAHRAALDAWRAMELANGLTLRYRDAATRSTDEPPPPDDEPDDEPPPDDDDGEDSGEPARPRPDDGGLPEIPEGAKVIEVGDTSGNILQGLASETDPSRLLVIKSKYPDRRAKARYCRSRGGEHHNLWLWGIEAPHLSIRDSNGGFMRGLAVIDCVYQGQESDIQFHSSDSGGIDLIRTAFLDSGLGSQGLYVTGITTLAVRQCIFDHNGWEPDSGRSQFDQGLYIQSDVRGDVSVIDSLFTRNAAHGLQQRPGGLTRHCVMWRNALAMLSGGGDPESGSTRADWMDVSRNLVMESVDRADGAGAVGIELNRPRTGRCIENIVLDRAGSNNRAGIQALHTGEGDEPILIADNIVRNWSRDGRIVDTSDASAPHYEVRDNREITGGPPLPDMESIIDYHRTRPLGAWDDSKSARALYDSVNEAID